MYSQSIYRLSIYFGENFPSQREPFFPCGRFVVLSLDRLRVRDEKALTPLELRYDKSPILHSAVVAGARILPRERSSPSAPIPADRPTRLPDRDRLPAYGAAAARANHFTGLPHSSRRCWLSCWSCCLSCSVNSVLAGIDFSPHPRARRQDDAANRNTATGRKERQRVMAKGRGRAERSCVKGGLWAAGRRSGRVTASRLLRCPRWCQRRSRCRRRPIR